MKIVVSPVIKAQCNITMMIIAISSEHLHNRSKDQVGSAAARPPGSPQTPPHNASDLLSFSNSFVLFISSVCLFLYFRSSPQPPLIMPRISCHFPLLQYFSFPVYLCLYFPSRPQTPPSNSIDSLPFATNLVFFSISSFFLLDTPYKSCDNVPLASSTYLLIYVLFLYFVRRSVSHITFVPVFNPFVLTSGFTIINGLC